MSHIKLLVTLLACSCLVLLVSADLSLTSTALVKERQFYESTVGHAAQAVLKQLNKDHEASKGSKISKVDMDATQVAESVLYSLNLQMDIGDSRGLNYGFKFVQPLSSWRTIGASNALPSAITQPSTSLVYPRHGSTPSYSPPEIALTLSGPLELYFPHSTTDISVRTPRYVDAGFIDRIVLREGANITLTGSVELRLRESLAIEPSLSEDGFLSIDTEDRIKLNVYGNRIEIKNMDGEELKVQKKYSSVLEIEPRKGHVVKSGGRLPFQIPLNDSRVENIQRVLMQISQQENSPHFPSVHSLSTGSSMEAVLSFLIPLEVEDETAGKSAKYDVMVVQGSNHKEAQVISIEKQKVFNQVSFSQDIINNGTISDAYENISAYLRLNDRMI